MKGSQSHFGLIRPALSVVVGSQNARHSVGRCLGALVSQCNGEEVEIIVVDNSTDGTAKIVSEDFPAIKVVRPGEDKLMPELWEIGINQTEGDVVALTTAHFVPDQNWIAEILKAHQSTYAGIGGAIENDESAGLISWAVYFCRYSPYMLPFREVTVDDFAGDNASYKRAALDRFRDARRKGFWELFIHNEMRKEGLELLLTPKIVVYHQKSFSLPSFMSQRFWHGRQFGGERASSISPLKRLIYILLSPLIPAVFLLRITRRVFDKRKHIRKYLLSLPILTLFLLGWAAGELTG
ncbi:MAG: glycosyltransferase, partial [Pyrinomonadaceae bacterium]|nr:glycosyltransferase [Pyrinomonadaceae bacterium]